MNYCLQCELHRGDSDTADRGQWGCGGCAVQGKGLRETAGMCYCIVQALSICHFHGVRVFTLSLPSASSL